MAHCRHPAVWVISRGSYPELYAFLVQLVARQRHPVLPADEATDAIDASFGHVEVSAVSEAVEQSLVHCRHQLPVFPQQPLRAEEDDRVIQRPRTFYLAFVDADDAVDIELPARSHELLDERPGTSTDDAHRRPHISSNPSNLAA